MTTKPKARLAKKPKAITAKTVAKPRPVLVEVPSPLAREVNFNPVLHIVGANDRSLWSLSLPDRLAKQFSDAGVIEIVDEARALQHTGPVVLVRADAVIDQPLVSVIPKRPNFLLLSDDVDNPLPLAACVRSADVKAAIDVLNGNQPVSSAKLLARTPSQLGADFWKVLRKRETPYAMTLTPENQSTVEWRMFMGTYKGATDLVTKHLWPTPAFYTTRFLAPLGVTPNMVTAVGAIMTALAFWFFLQGQFVPGLLAAWAMTFLDTVDGKLARTTLTASKWGDVFDHGIDLIHPPFWYIAWATGLFATGTQWSDQLFWLVMAAILGGYVLQRVIEGIAIKWLALEIHIWRPIDTLFRQVTARRNPNLVLLTMFTIVGRPDWGLLAVAIWTVACLALHTVQIVQAFNEKRQNGALSSWMTKP